MGGCHIVGGWCASPTPNYELRARLHEESVGCAHVGRGVNLPQIFDTCRACFHHNKVGYPFRKKSETMAWFEGSNALHQNSLNHSGI